MTRSTILGSDFVCQGDAPFSSFSFGFGMLYLIGLGLGDQDDITVKGLNAINSCQKVYLEAYTSVLGVDRAVLVQSLIFLGEMSYSVH